MTTAQDTLNSTYQSTTINPKLASKPKPAPKQKHAVITGVRFKGEYIDGTYPVIRKDRGKVVIQHPVEGAIRVPKANAEIEKRARATKAEMALRRADPAYQASLAKPKRHRATNADMKARRASLYSIVQEQAPVTVRGAYYQATVRGVIEKTEDGYNKVQTELADMRRAGALPYGWIVDNTREMRKPKSFGGVVEAITHAADYYRKNLWQDADEYVEIWLEKDALSGVIGPITSLYDVPLMVARGYASLTFLHSAAQNIASVGKPTYIYHLGDFDPSGVNAGEKIEETLRELAPKAEIHFERLAVNPKQIAAWKLPTRPTKKTDPRAKGFGDESVELDAIPPKGLRWLVREALRRHISDEELAEFQAEEASERDELKDWAAHIRRWAEDD